MNESLTFYSEDGIKKAVIANNNIVWFFENNEKIAELMFSDKSIHYAISAAENFCLDILKVGKYASNTGSNSIEPHL